jgi:hypothetical protein
MISNLKRDSDIMIEVLNVGKGLEVPKTVPNEARQTFALV